MDKVHYETMAMGHEKIEVYGSGMHYIEYNHWEIAEIFKENSKHGKILEAMCGTETYLKDTPENEITGLDVSFEGLNYYPNHRRRIICDLNQLSATTVATIAVFPSEEFSAIFECYGYKYPKDILAVFMEFHRILKNNGTLFMLENTNPGYSSRVRKFLGTKNHKEELHHYLEVAGFKEITFKFKEWWSWQDNNEQGTYLITAKK